MQHDGRNQAAPGCLKSLLSNGFILIFFCCAWYVLLGDNEILVGIMAFIAMHSAKLFLKVFGDPPQVPSLGEPDRDPPS